MSFQLKNLDTNEEFDCGRAYFGHMLDIAQAFGWEPTGTVIDGYPDWCGSYRSNDMQVITPTDGEAMAKALLLAAEHSTGGPNVRFTAEELTTMSAFVRDGNIMLY